MKILSMFLMLTLLFSGIVMAEETMQLDREFRMMPDPDTYDSIVREVDRDDRMERCVSRLQREFAETPNKDFESACKRIFANLDDQDTAVETLRERFRLTSDQAERLSKVRAENRERLEQLNQERLEKFADLDVANLERISTMSKERLEMLASLDEDQIERFSRLSRTAMREYEDKSLDEIKEMLRKARSETVTPEKAGGRRTISDNAADIAKEKYDDAKKRYEKARERYAEARKEFSSLISEEKRICESGTSDECQEAVEESIKKAKEYFEELGNQQLEYLEQLRARVLGSDSFTEGEAEDIIEEIDDYVAKINRALEYLSTAETKSEVKEAARSLTEAIKRIQIKVMDRRENLIYLEGKKYVHRAEALEVKLDRMLASLKDSGVDVSVYDEDIEKFTSLISQANDKLGEGREYFEEFRESENPSENLNLLESAKESFSMAHELLVEANKLFSDIKEMIWEDTKREFDDEEDEVEVLVINEPKLIDPPSLEEIEVAQ